MELLPGGIASCGFSLASDHKLGRVNESRNQAQEYTGRLEEAGIAVSRDGRGRALDNVFVERPWRSVKYEDIHIKNYEQVQDLESGLRAYFWFYDDQRPHQSLAYRPPGEVYRAGIHGG